MREITDIIFCLVPYDGTSVTPFRRGRESLIVRSDVHILSKCERESISDMYQPNYKIWVFWTALLCWLHCSVSIR